MTVKKLNRNNSYVRIESIDEYAFYQDETFSGTNDYLINILKFERAKISPADGNVFIAMYISLQKQEQNLLLTKVSYFVPEKWSTDGSPSVIY